MGAPNGWDDKDFPWGREGEYLDTKYPFVLHAERNAVLNYRGVKTDMKDAVLYVTLFPCNECAKELAQVGIKKVVYLEDKYVDQKETKASKRLLEACGIEYVQFSEPINKQVVLQLK